MKAPTKPTRPSKPYPPNKEQKVHKHAIDVFSLFRKEQYFDDDGKEISKEQYDAGTEDGDSYAFDCETQDLTPSIKSIMDLVPAGTNTDDIHIELDLGYDTGRSYAINTFDGISVFYTTPYIYEDELATYNKQLVKYEKDLVGYNQKMKQYKEDMAEYKKDKELVRLEKKKANLQAELAALNSKGK